ncbi:MAG: carboxypeptidase regulatory-like domain-containing protein [Candidatus Kerfeldbacteria bacterium]|nr:carboxypeptidase regulatory-like domain-containing protein [Candidatus Kerfeldbacteria bacterium]
MVGFFSLQQRWLAILAFSVCILLAWTSATFATTVDDDYITAVSVSSVSSQVLGATAQYSISFTTDTTLPADSQLYLHTYTAGCAAADYTSCNHAFSAATITGISGSVIDSGTVLTIQLSTALSPGSHTLTVSNVTNPSSAVAARFGVEASASTETDSTMSYVTMADQPTIFGNQLLSGILTMPAGTALRYANVSLHNSDWSIYGSTSADEWGYYSLFTDYFDAGYWSAGEYTAAVYPNTDSGYLVTEQTVTYDGSSTINGDITVDAAVTFFTGIIVYGDNDSATVTSAPGDPITNASVYFYPTNGGSGYNATTDSTGHYNVGVRAGTYQVSVYANIDRSNAEQAAALDWIYNGQGESFAIVTAETQNVDFTVTRTTSLLSGMVTGPDGAAVIGTVQLSNDNSNYSGYTSSDGSYLMNLNPGTYTVYFYPNTSENALWERYYLESTTITIVEGNNSLTVALAEKNSAVHFIVTDQSGNPLPDIQAQAWRENEWVSANTNDAGEATLYLQAGKKYDINVWSEEYIYNENASSLTVAENETVDVSFTMFVPDAAIAVLVKDAAGAVPTELYGYAWCNDSNYQHNYGASINNGVGTINLLVNETTGQFTGQCSLWVSDETLGAAQAQTVTVSEGETGQIEFTLVPRNATVTIFIKNNNGKLIKNATAGRVFLSNKENTTWYDAMIDEDGEVSINVVPGTYTGGVWFEDQSYIPIWSKNNGTTTVAAEETGKLVLTVLSADATVSGRVKDPNGNPVEFAWVYCGNWEEVNVGGDFEEGTIIDSGGQVTNGEFSVAVVSGHTYQCGVGLPPEYANEGWLSPAHQTVDFTGNKTSVDDVKFNFTQADSSLVATVTVAATTAGVAGTDDLDNIWCWAWSEEGSFSYNEVIDATTQLALQSGQHWQAGCDAQVGNDWYWTDEPFDRFIEEAGEYSKEFNLTKSDTWIFYDSVSETFSASENKTIVLGDGTTLTIPANALASSGDVTVTASPMGDIIRTGDNLLNVPWNFEAFQGDTLIETFTADVTIEIQYTDDHVLDLGIDEDNLLPKYWDEISGAWKQPDNITQDKDANTITITTDHFTQYGVTYNANLTANQTPAKPRQLKAKQPTSASAKLTWKKPKDSTVQKYKVQLRKHGNKKSSSWTTYANVKKHNKTVHSLHTNTKYDFRVRACNGAGCSAYSDWKRFKTQ